MDEVMLSRMDEVKRLKMEHAYASIALDKAIKSDVLAFEVALAYKQDVIDRLCSAISRRDRPLVVREVYR